MFFIASSLAATAGFAAGLAAGGTLLAGAAGARKMRNCSCCGGGDSGRSREGR